MSPVPHGASPTPPAVTVSVARMQQIDAEAIEGIGIPRLLLMEHAGLAVARATHALSPDPSHPIGVCCGTGWNGGDGLAAARHLHAWGYPLRVLVIGRVERLRDEPAIFAGILKRLGVTILEGEGAEWSGGRLPAHVECALRECGVLIDALLGIGIHGPVREPFASLITGMSRLGKPIVAVDIPSGLDGDTGCVQGVAVRATITVAFGLAKRGCTIQDGPAHTGSLMVDPITIPPHLLEMT